jgi:hypothetical protein
VRFNDVIKLTAAQRSRLRSWNKVRKLGPRVKRKAFSRDELLDYLKQGGIRSWRVLEKKRSTFDPTTFDYRKEFGSWRKAVEVAFGSGSLRPEIDVLYVLRAVPYFNAWTWRKYKEARKAHPDVLPSVNFILHEWGKFSRFVFFARGQFLATAMNDYRAVWRKLGRRPTVDECQAHGVNLEFATAFFGSKYGLDWQISRTVDKKEKA